MSCLYNITILLLKGNITLKKEAINLNNKNRKLEFHH